MTTPTREARRKYIQMGGVRCLFCGSEQIEGGPFDCDAGVVWQEIRCLDCGEEWQDIHHLADVQNSDWEETAINQKDCKGAPKARLKELSINLGNVDWKLLRRQKESLVRATSVSDVQISKKCQEDLTGILHLLDHIQDHAAEQIGERTVFGRGKDRHE
jgi:hypothetical protein